jgi:Ca2+-binding EF-hand superfamily protein
MVTSSEICDMLEKLEVGMDEDQRDRLMSVIDVDESGSVDVNEFRRSLRLGNAVFHKSVRRRRYDERGGGEFSIPDFGRLFIIYY